MNMKSFFTFMAGAFASALLVVYLLGSDSLVFVLVVSVMCGVTAAVALLLSMGNEPSHEDRRLQNEASRSSHDDDLTDP